MLQLPDVTLVCADTSCHELSAMAIEDCLKAADFGATALFSNTAFLNMPTLPIEELYGVVKWSEFFWYEVPKYIRTSHLLLIHWDSWIIDPGMWKAEYYDYDYIGAPWPWLDQGHAVGNGGFSLRSRRLMNYLADSRDRYPCTNPEDLAICCAYRRDLERAGFKWAPWSIANDFSFERGPKNRQFGFHGVFNWPVVLPADRLQQRLSIAQRNPYIMKRGMLNELNIK